MAMNLARDHTASSCHSFCKDIQGLVYSLFMIPPAYKTKKNKDINERADMNKEYVLECKLRYARTVFNCHEMVHFVHARIQTAVSFSFSVFSFILGRSLYICGPRI